MSYCPRPSRPPRPAYQVPANLTGGDIRSLVEQLFIPEPELPAAEQAAPIRQLMARDDGESFGMLKAIGSPAVPFLVAALNDPRIPSHGRKMGDFLDTHSAFNRICTLIEPFHPAEAVVPISNHLRHPCAGFRQKAGYQLGHMAAAACAEPVIEALSGSDEKLRTWTLMGISHAVNGDRSDPEFATAIFPALARLANWRDSHGNVPALMLKLDPARAVPILLSPECFSIGNPQLEYVLKALNDAGRKVPHHLLFPVIEQLEPLAGARPHTGQLSQALHSYAANPDGECEARLRELVHSPVLRVGAAAAQGLTILKGLNDILGGILEDYRAGRSRELPLAQQHYYNVFMYDADVSNGGHLQYLGNFEPECYRLAIEGLRAMNAPQRAGMLSSALQVFGPAGPPEDRERRRDFLYDELSEEQDNLLRQLDSDYFNRNVENVEMLLALYAVDHHEDFLPVHVA